MKMIQLSILVFVFLMSNSFAMSADIEIAIAERDEAVKNARIALRAGYQGVIAKAIESGDVERSTQLRRFVEGFENEDALYLVSGMKPFILHYFKTLRSAGDSLREEYLKEIKAANAAMDFDLAEQLAQELTDQRIPEKTVSYKVASENSSLGHTGFQLFSKYQGTDTKKFHATWEEVPGLSSTAFVSIRPINWPNRYIDHYGYRVKLGAYQENTAWKKHATWSRVPGLSNSKTGVSFRSVTHPDRYIRVRDNGEVWLDRRVDNQKFKSQATFFVRDGLFRVR